MSIKKTLQNKVTELRRILRSVGSGVLSTRGKIKTLTNNLQRLNGRQKKILTTAAVILTIIMVAVVVPLNSVQHARAFGSLAQTDWSDGVGTDPAHQYESADNVNTSTPGQITLGSTTSTGWCATATCDSDWTYRQKITLTNDSADKTDYVARVDLDYSSHMNTDFSDVRFTNEAGDTDYGYYTQTKIDGNSAKILVKIPSVLTGTSTMYIYFGNASAQSLSDASTVAVLTDNFEALSQPGVTDYTPWTNSGTDVVFVDGKAIFASNGNWGSLQTASTYPRSAGTYTIEFNLTTQEPTSNCTGTWLLNFTIANTNAYWYGDKYTGCGNSQNGWALIAVNTSGGSKDFWNNGRAGISFGSVVRYRVVLPLDGPVEWYSSTDGGTQYTKIETVPGGYDGDNFNVSMYTSGYSMPNEVSNLLMYVSSGDVSLDIGFIEKDGGKTGYLTSVGHDLGAKPYFGNAEVTFAGTGEYGLRVRTASQPDMSDARPFGTCNVLQDGDDIKSSRCVVLDQRYVQYQILLHDDVAADLAIQSISLEYGNDAAPPGEVPAITTYQENGGQVIQEHAWISHANPYYTWSSAVDDDAGSGVKGYCLYLGEDSSADPQMTKGVIGGISPIEVPGCPYAVAGTSFDTAVSGLTDDINDGDEAGRTFYFTIRVVDNAGNLSATSTQTNYRLDDDAPFAYLALSSESGVINHKDFTINWSPAFYGPPVDQLSGVAGVKYCITNILLGFQGCGLYENESDRNHWFGLDHGSGRPDDPTDIIPFNQKTYKMRPVDFDRIDDNGLNSVLVSVLDNAGNSTIFDGHDGSDFSQLVVNISQAAPSAPLNLAVTPPTNSVNQFSFSWSNPSTYVGPPQAIKYCWTVNEPIASDASNCNWTAAGAHALPNGAYAMRQGQNTLYLMAKNQAENFNAQNVTSIDFTANTAAPGAPQNVDVSDVSVRATSAWKLALSWSPPTVHPEGIDSYKILRSLDNVTYSEVGNTTTSNLSFIDTNLNQSLYYYKVQACDNAGACSTMSDAVSMKPSGRFTSPATLVGGPTLSGVGTHTATMKWTTNRDSDSKVAIGTSSGNYAPEETGSSDQTPSHSVGLASLQAGTTYYYVVKWTDVDGNTGTSPEYSFSTIPAPTVGEVTVSNIGVGSATVNFTVSYASSIRLYYGESSDLGRVKQINTSSSKSTYAIPLDDLRDGTRYVFKLNGFDADGKEYPEQGTLYSFTTLAMPKVTNVRFQTMEDEPSSTQKITWDTNVLATSELSYGVQGTRAEEVIDSKLTLSHEVVVRNLEDDKQYELIVRSRDSLGNVARSDVQVLRTALDTRPPRLADVSIDVQIKGTSGDAQGQIVISWHTDEPATSQVSFALGAAGASTSLTSEDARLTTEHVVVVSNLSLSSIYQVKAISHDKSGNLAQSDPETVIIGRGSDNIFSIIFSSLQRIFGVKL